MSLNEAMDESSSDEHGGGGLCFKTMRAVEPDVTVTVGGVEFPHYSTFLCCNSDYFDAMLSVDMKEKAEKRIDFADKDPEEWKLFYSFIDPRTCSTAKLTTENVDRLLPWFHEFAMEARLMECDTIMCRRLETYESTDYDGFAKSVVLARLFDLTRTSELAEYRILKATDLNLLQKQQWDLKTIEELTPAWVAKGELWDRFVTFRMFPENWAGKTECERREISESPIFGDAVLSMYQLMMSRSEIQQLVSANADLQKQTLALAAKNEVQLGLECYIRSLHHGAFFDRRKVVPVHILKNIYEINEGYLTAAGIGRPNWG
jgi:hypothetical protein